MEANNTPKYTLSFVNGRTMKIGSMDQAIRMVRAQLGAPRVYRGAQYEHPDGGMALDIWRTKADATAERGVCADCVITWEVAR